MTYLQILNLFDDNELPREPELAALWDRVTIPLNTVTEEEEDS